MAIKLASRKPYEWPKPPEPEVSQRGAIKGRSSKGKRWSLHDVPGRQVRDDLTTLIEEFGIYFPATDFITMKQFRQGYRRTEYTAIGKGPDDEKVKYWAMEGSQGDRRIRLWIGKEEVTPDNSILYSTAGWPILVESVAHLIKYLNLDAEERIKRYQPIEGIEWS